MTFSSNILSAATAQALEFPSLLAIVARLAASDLESNGSWPWSPPKT